MAKLPGTSSGSAYNDLGFLFNTSSGAINSKFAGTTTNPSKRGYMPRPLSQAETRPPRHLDETDSEMLAKRTNYLEEKEKRLTATVSDGRSQQNLLKEQVGHNKTALSKQSARTEQLFNESQFLYGVAQRTVFGFQCIAEHDTYRTLTTYRDQPLERAAMTCQICKANETVLLTYPMEKVAVDKGYILLMRCKKVDPQTAQLSSYWAVVFEDVDGKEKRHVSQYSLAPG